MIDVERDFRLRCREIIKHLNTLRFIEDHGAFLVSPSGASRQGEARMKIDINTRHVMKASTLLHFYNLVESTVYSCLREIGEEIVSQRVSFRDLSQPWQEAFLRDVGKIGDPLNPDRRLENLKEVCVAVSPGSVAKFSPRLSAGNLNDDSIGRIFKRHGLSLRLGSRLQMRIKRHVVDNMGVLELVRVRRNQLAHGQISFADCGRVLTVVDLRGWAASIIRYLRVVLLVTSTCILTAEFRAQSA